MRVLMATAMVVGATEMPWPEACTATAVGRLATAEGSTVVTQTVDCYNCDFRLAKVTAHEEPHLVRKYRGTYPSEVSERATTWREAPGFDLDPEADEPPFRREAQDTKKWTSEAWKEARIAGWIALDEFDEDYESFEGLYGILNEKGLSMAESTCEATLVGRPVRSCFECPGPLFDIAALSKVAMRVCATARCAISVMGQLAEKHGFYGAELKTVEAGEALAIADGVEAWMFHIMPDVSGFGAIWVAQRIPDDAVSVCANSFVIRGVPRTAMTEAGGDVMASPNLYEQAELQRSTFKYPVAYDSRGDLDFAKTFGPRPDNVGFPYSVHRVWRVFSLLAPNATRFAIENTLEPDYLGSELPFAMSIAERGDDKVTIHEVLAYQRDYYEGTNFDLTKGLAAGPWGDPTRTDGAVQSAPTTDPEVSSLMPRDLPELLSGRFERAISMFRTSQCVVVQSFSTRKPGVLWFAQSAPHAAIFVPLTLDAGDAPKPLTEGSLFEVNRGSLFWQTTMIANWMRANCFRCVRADVHRVQLRLETAFHQALLNDPDDKSDTKKADRNAAFADLALTAWSDLFNKLVAKYHDGLVLHRGLGAENSDAPDLRKHFYPNWWLKQVGYYSPKSPFAYYDHDHHNDPSPQSFLQLVQHSTPSLLLNLPPLAPALLNVLLSVGLLVLGFLLGRALERKLLTRPLLP